MAAGDGLVTMTPTSIAVAGAGSSASINADGGVDFTSATSLSLNGVFTSSFDNYLLVVRHVHSATDTTFQFRLRLSGTDASGSNYTQQLLRASSTTVQGVRETGTAGNMTFISATQRSGHSTHFYGPALAQPTAYRTVSASGSNSAQIEEWAGTHSLSTSYDGITLVAPTGSMTGNVVVFGYEE